MNFRHSASGAAASSAMATPARYPALHLAPEFPESRYSLTGRLLEEHGADHISPRQKRPRISLSEDSEAFTSLDVNKNTYASTITWTRKWNEYKRDVDAKFEDTTVSKPELNYHLEQFFAQVRQDNGEEFKDSTLQVGFAALARYFKGLFEKRSEQLNIHDDLVFKGACQVFRGRLRQLRQNGHTGTKSTSKFSKSEIKRILDSEFCNPSTPDGLLHRVYVHVTLYLMERGDSLAMMMRNEIEEEHDESGAVYYLRAKPSKNSHNRPDVGNPAAQYNAIPSGPAAMDIRNYLARRSNCSEERFFLAPNRQSYLKTGNWYKNTPVGKNVMYKWVQEACRSAGIDTTNRRLVQHSFRLTATSAWSESNEWAWDEDGPTDEQLNAVWRQLDFGVDATQVPPVPDPDLERIELEPEPEPASGGSVVEVVQQGQRIEITCNGSSILSLSFEPGTTFTFKIQPTIAPVNLYTE
ncbi:hypothetical protein BC832DRAFT_552624 [Gaertneriomyces semiglobifer]|nr:hypothetical protein BC832DRAFT_552624 [Gaertneriomyces semiglobifer]